MPYIHVGTFVDRGRARAIASMAPGEYLAYPPPSFSEVPEGKALVVIYGFGGFEIVRWADCELEFEALTRLDVPQEREYVLVNLAWAQAHSDVARFKPADEAGALAAPEEPATDAPGAPEGAPAK